MDVSGLAQGGVVTLLTGMIGWLFWKRTSNQVKNTNAAADRESTFQDNIQKRLDQATAEIQHLREIVAEIALLKKRLSDRDRTIRVLLDSLDSEQQRSARKWAPESAFAPLESDLPIQPKPRKD